MFLKYFDTMPRRRQKEAHIGVKNQIRRAESILGGSFHTNDYRLGAVIG